MHPFWTIVPMRQVKVAIALVAAACLVLAILDIGRFAALVVFQLMAGAMLAIQLFGRRDAAAKPRWHVVRLRGFHLTPLQQYIGIIATVVAIMSLLFALG